MGTWYGLTVQIRQISGHNVLVTAITGSATDKYYPRGDNFWGSFSVDPNAAGLQSCLNAGSTGFGGLALPGGLNPPAGYHQGTEADGAVYYELNGGSTPNPCDFSTPRNVGTWNGLIVQIRQFPNNKRALVTAIANASNDKYYPRGDNFWDNFTKNADAEQYRACLNAGDTPWWGLGFPGVSTPPGYQQGTESDGAVFFSTNGQRKAAPQATVQEGAPLVTVHPNPVQDEVTIAFVLSKAATVPIRVLDLQGKVLKQQTVQGRTGNNEHTIRLSGLPVGVYGLEVTIEQQRSVTKLIKE